MTPQQKIKWLILSSFASFQKTDIPVYPCEDIDTLYDNIINMDFHWDAKNEVRCGGIETNLPCDGSRHYEAKSMAMKMPDNSWVGWTFWYGGGKHAEPESVDWVQYAYDVDCVEEEQTITIQTFSATVFD